MTLALAWSRYTLGPKITGTPSGSTFLRNHPSFIRGPPDTRRDARMMGPLPRSLILTAERMQPVTARNEKRKSDLGDQVNQKIATVVQYASQLNSAWNAKLGRLDTRFGNVSEKWQKGINWFFAVGTTEDDTGRVYKVTPQPAPARKESIKTVRFERLSSLDENNLKITRLYRAKNRRDRAKRQKGIAKARAKNRAREQKRRLEENAYYASLQADYNAQQCIEQCVMSGALDSDQVLDEMYANDAILRSLEQSWYQDTYDEGTGNDISGYLPSIKEEPEEDAEQGNRDPNRIVTWEIVVPTSTLDSIAARTFDPNIHTFSAIIEEKIYLFMLLEHLAKQSRAKADNDAETDTYEGAKARGRAGSWLHHPKHREIINAFHEKEEAKYLAAKAAAAEEATFEQSTFEEATLEDTLVDETVEEAAIEHAAVKEVAPEGFALDWAAIDQTAVEHAGVEEAALEGFALHRVSIAKEAAPGEFAFDWSALKEVTIEDAVIENAALEEVAVHEVVVQEATVEENLIEEAAIKDTVIENAITENAAIEFATIEAAAIEGVVVQEPGLEESAVLEATVQEATVDETSIEEAALEDTLIEGAALKDAAIEKVSLQKVALEDAATKESAIQEPTVEETALEEVVTEVAATEDITTENNAIEDTTTEDTATEDDAAIQAAVVRTFAHSTLLKIDEAIQNAALEDHGSEFWYGLRLSLERTQVYYMTVVTAMVGGEVLVRLPKRPDAELRLGVYVPVNKRNRSQSLGALRI